MHLLVTTDTVGGVWTYTRELVRGLVSRGHKVSLISFGNWPTKDQLAWLSDLPEVHYRPTHYGLEWMQDAAQDIDQSIEYLCSLVRELNPDLLHFNQFAYGSLPVNLPRIVVAHSDVLSWWSAVYGVPPPDNEWFRWYIGLVSNGLNNATAVVAPSRTMLRALKSNFNISAETTVIHNGRDPDLFRNSTAQKNGIMSVGRLWDQAKQVTLLMQQRHSAPLKLVGPVTESLATSPVSLVGEGEIQFLGQRSESDLCRLLAETAIYAATSQYEPFGLAPLEAALSGCALVTNDIPAFHEVWGDAALYFRRNDPKNLAECIELLVQNPHLRNQYAERAYLRARENFTADMMVDRYEALYRQAISLGACA